MSVGALSPPGQLGVCRSCRRPIRWLATETSSGRRFMPLDADPSPLGNVVVRAGLAHVLHEGEGASLTLDELLYMPHFATCPAGARGRTDEARARQRTLARVRRDVERDPGPVDPQLRTEIERWARGAARRFLPAARHPRS